MPDEWKCFLRSAELAGESVVGHAGALQAKDRWQNCIGGLDCALYCGFDVGQRQMLPCVPRKELVLNQLGNTRAKDTKNKKTHVKALNFFPDCAFFSWSVLLLTRKKWQILYYLLFIEINQKWYQCVGNRTNASHLWLPTTRPLVTSNSSTQTAVVWSAPRAGK